MSPTERADLLLGTLDLLVLKVLELRPLHGLGVARRIEQVTRGTFQVKPGSLFPALYRMEHAGWLASTWGLSETNRRARYYRLTKAGHRRLADETEQWERVSAAMTLVLQTTD
jgi:PadR family transcriptional regulator, regulatory protein PadR